MEKANNDLIPNLRCDGIYIHDFDWDKIYESQLSFKGVMHIIKFKILRFKQPVLIIRFKYVLCPKRENTITHLLLELTETTLYKAIRLSWYKWYEDYFDYKKRHNYSGRFNNFPSLFIKYEEAKKITGILGHNKRYSIIHNIQKSDQITYRMINEEFEIFCLDSHLFLKNRTTEKFEILGGLNFRFIPFSEFHFELTKSNSKMEYKNYETNVKLLRANDESYIGA